MKNELQMRESQLAGLLDEADYLQDRLNELPWWAWRRRHDLTRAILLNYRSVRVSSHAISVLKTRIGLGR
jgi:hypothetical protein